MKAYNGLAVSVKAAKENINDVKNFIINCVIFLLTTIIHHVVVVLKTPRRIGDRVLNSYNIHDMMSASTWFPVPFLSFADFKLLIQKYEAAAISAKSRIPGAADILALAWEELDAGRKLMRSYVEAICCKNPANAMEIAHSAGMSVRGQTKKEKQDFSVKATSTGNGAELCAKVKYRGCSHIWQCSVNPEDPMSWSQKLIPCTTQCRTKVYGFPSKTTIYFRHKAVTKDGETDWDPVISLFIL
jgi:hypothetical protein